MVGAVGVFLPLDADAKKLNVFVLTHIALPFPDDKQKKKIMVMLMLPKEQWV